MVYIKQACFARQNLLPNNSFLVIQLTYSVKKFEVVKKSEKVEEVQKSRVTDVEQVLTGRYSSQLQLSSGLGMLVCLSAKVTENRAKDFLAFWHECSLL